MYQRSKLRKKTKRTAMRQILLPTTVRMEMVKTFKITRSTLDRALKYSINSSHANMLRAAAMQRGGRVYTGQVVEPEAEAVIEMFRETCPKRLDGPRFFHDACDMSCSHGRALQSRLDFKK